MTESGGPTTQSGVSYQNLYAARHAAAMLSGANLPDNRRIEAVRSEAPVPVDDVVLTYADEHRRYVQAKEALRLTGDVWTDTWKHFENQYRAADFNSDVDEIYLVVGESTGNFEELKSAFERVQGKLSFEEWQTSLTEVGRKLWREKIEPCLSLEPSQVWPFVQCVRIQVLLRATLEDEGLRYLPEAYGPNNAPEERATVWAILKSRFPDEARHRVEMTRRSLEDQFQSENKIRFAAPPPTVELLQAIKKCSATLRGQRHSIGRSDKEIPRAATNEILSWLRSPAPTTNNIAILLDGPGHGKTVALRGVLVALEEEGAPVLAIKADLQLSDLEAGRAINQCRDVSLPASIEDVVTWLARERAEGSTPVVVLLDQVDALSQSMARDARALEAVSNLTARLRGIEGVRVVLACRTFDYNTIPELQSLDVRQKFALPQLDDAEVAAALQDCGIASSQLATATLKLLRVPLHLALFVRALEGEGGPLITTPQTGDAVALTSLQELYGLLWERFIASENEVLITDRIEVLRRLVEEMETRQKLTAPQSLFHNAQTERLAPAVTHLASAGILQSVGMASAAQWGFLHQTFYDYCHARFFVEEGRDIAEEIINGPQGLDERPLLKNVLSFLRATDEPAYARAMIRLGVSEFFETGLRAHLRELLRSWFGALPTPSDLEWRWAREYLRDEEQRAKFLMAASGSGVWLERLAADYLPHRLMEFDAPENDLNLESRVYGFLQSFGADAEAQSRVLHLLRPYLHRSDQWDNRLANWLVVNSQWKDEGIAALYEELLVKFWDGDTMFHYQLRDIAKAQPVAACRIVHRVFALVLERMTATPNETSAPTTNSYSHPFSELDDDSTGGLKLDDEVLNELASGEPEALWEAVWEYFSGILPLGSEYSGYECAAYFPSDSFHDVWEARTTDGVLLSHHFGYTLADAMKKSLVLLAVDATGVFDQWRQRLSALEFQTPQLMLLEAFAAFPQRHAAIAANWLAGDSRRLLLGKEQWESRRLIREIAPHLEATQIAALETEILRLWPLREQIKWSRNTIYLRKNGVEQWRLLHALGRERLSEIGKRRLREWNDKFHNWQLPDRPITEVGGIVGSPIDMERARKMSDGAWLKAMQHYQNDVRYRGESLSLRGGAQQLAAVMGVLVKEQPRRFARLALDYVPLDVDRFYINALIEGLAESDVSSESFFAVARRFLECDREEYFRETAKTIARALRERAADGIPDDLLQWLEARVLGVAPAAETEGFYLQQQEKKTPSQPVSNGQPVHYETLNGGAVSDFLNSTRGSSFSALMAALRGRNESEQQWLWIERMTTEPFDGLRVGALEEMRAIELWDDERALTIFEKLVEGHPAVLRSQFAFMFLRWAIYRYPDRAEPFVRALMADTFENLSRQGAQLFSMMALRQPPDNDESFWKEIYDGQATWRAGAAEVLANSVAANVKTETRRLCAQALPPFFNDEDEDVRRQSARWTQSLREEHLETLAPLIELFLSSTAYGHGAHWLQDFLWKHGALRPDWTMQQIEIIIEQGAALEATKEASRRFEYLRHLGGNELVRCVLRLYGLPEADDTLRRRALEAFGTIMERTPHHTNAALRELDEGRYF